MVSKSYDKGFTLLEISISIAIIALIVVSITAGVNLKRKLEINQVIEDISLIKDVVLEFKARTSFLPGDYPFAENQYNISNINGDGDFQLNVNSNSNEKVAFWHHLSLEGLIDGSFDSTEITNKLGRMSGSIDNSLYWADTYYLDEWWGSGSAHGDIYIRFGRGPDGGDTNAAIGILTTKEAYDLDAKYDDHNYKTGNIRASEESGVTDKCIVSDNYNLENKEDTPCVMYFFLGVIN